MPEYGDTGVMTAKAMESSKVASSKSGLSGVAEVFPEVDEVEEMDERKWTDLPEELLASILAGLPLQSLFRLRSVCKKWNALLRDSNVVDMFSQMRTQVPFCVRQVAEGYAAYDPTSNRWHFWPCSFILGNYSLSMSSTTSVPFRESGSAGGLLLVEGYGSHGRVLHVANPITKSQKQIPLISELEDSFTSTIEGMVVDKKSGSYKILAVDHGFPDEVFLYDFYAGVDEENDEDDPVKVYVYDSKRSSWEISGRWQRGISQTFQRPAFHNGSLYCLTSDLEPFQFSCQPPTHHVFRLDRESWHELPAQIPSPLSFAHLFEMRGRLMLAGGYIDSMGLLSVYIWQLDEVGEEWVEMMTMPADLAQALSIPMEAHFRSHISCVGNAGYVCVSSISRKLNVCNTVMCNVFANFWWLLPTHSNKSYSGTFLFAPRLDMLV